MRPLSRVAAFVLGLALAAPGVARADDADANAEDSKRQADAKKVEAPVNLDLDGRIRPVTGHLFLKQKRHELAPTLDLSLNDAFFTKYVLGVRYAFHITERWSAGFHAGYALSTPSGAVSRCDSRGDNCTIPTKEQLVRAPGDFGLVGGLDVSWAPLYGKISVLAEKVLHFDTYVLAGGGVVQAKLAPPDQNVAAAVMSPEFHVGVGQRYFLGRSVALRLEVRDLVYALEIDGATDIQNQLMLGVGLSFFLGAMPES